MSKAQTSWIYRLSKPEVIVELEKRGAEVNSKDSIDVLRKLLKVKILEEAKAQIDTDDGSSSEDKYVGIEVENKQETGKDIVRATVNKLEPQQHRMDYNAKLDFELGVDDWEQFVERMDLYYVANDVTDENKK